MAEYLNKVIKSNGNFGQIRYVGPIAGLNDDQTEWFGIEWRDHSRGKHDGSYKGVRYFVTKHQTGGSFIRPNKVDFGVDIWKAIVSKYFDTDCTLDKEDTFLYNNLNFEDKLGVHCINLADCNVSSIENIQIVSERFPNVRELDLESNLFNSWSQIFTILNKMKKIKILCLSNNILSTDTLDNAENYSIFNNVQHLILNRMDYDWNDVLKVVKHFPNIVELKVCFNLIHKIDELNDDLKNNLKVLDLECNPIIRFSYFKKLGELKNLETLYANDVGISEINFYDCDYSSKTESFPQVSVLSLNSNKINDWKSINELNKLKCLTDLRFKFNPLNSTDKSENIRQLFVAKLSQLEILNRTKLGYSERMGSEIDYLKKFASEWMEVQKSDDKLQLEKFYYDHPCFQDLFKKYAAFIELRETKTEPETLQTSLIFLNLKNEETGKLIQKKIPSTIDIKRLKVLVSKLLKSSSMDLESVRLYYSSLKLPNEEFELDNDFRTLSFYSLENNDTIILKIVK